MTNEFQDIIYTVKDHIATITINRPQKMNTVTVDTMCEIESAFDMAGNDRTVGVVVFTGAGDKSFCAGADVSLQREGKMGRGRPTGYTPSYIMISRCPKPVIARVNGYAIGGGSRLAYYCDLTIAAEHAVFGQSEPRIAYPGSGPVVNYLVRIVGHKRAREMWMLGRRYSAATMYEWGLVNAVVPKERLDEEVAKWCDELLAVSPTCLKVYKASFVQEFEDLIGQGDFLRRALITPEFWKEEQKEGTTAFLEKRRADYSRFRQP